MDVDIIVKFKDMIYYSTIPGCAGGIAFFLLKLQKGRFKNNKYIAKFFIEVLGAMTTASFVPMLINKNGYQSVAAFFIGVAWSNIIQIIRIKITKIIEAAFGEIEKSVSK